MMEASFSRAVAALRREEGSNDYRYDENKGYDSEETEILNHHFRLQSSRPSGDKNASTSLSFPFSGAASTNRLKAQIDSNNQNSFISPCTTVTDTNTATQSSSTAHIAMTPNNRSGGCVTNNRSSEKASQKNTNTKCFLPPFESPTTQMLNSLSQGMDDLRYSPPSNVSQKSRLATNTSALKEPHKSNYYHLPMNRTKNWTLVPIHIPPHETSSLGIAILRDTFPELKPQPSKQHCVVKRVYVGQKQIPKQPAIMGCVGVKYGLKPGDWFLQPGLDYGRSSSKKRSHLLLADFGAIQDWSKSKPYKEVWVLRRKEGGQVEANAVPLKSNNAEQSHQKALTIAKSSLTGRVKADLTTFPIPSHEVAKTPALSKDDQKIAENQNATSVPPFCNRCNALIKNKKRIPRLHHAWCTQNHCFHNSGADDIMARIQQGRQLNCPACQQEFETGKPVTSIASRVNSSKKSNSNSTTSGDSSSAPRHNIACLQNQKKLEREQGERELREQKKESSFQQLAKGISKGQSEARRKQADPKRKRHEAVVKSKGRSIQLNKKVKGRNNDRKSQVHHMEASVASSDSNDEDDGDDVSIYQPAKKKSRIQVLTVRNSVKSSFQRSKANQHKLASKKTKTSKSRKVKSGNIKSQQNGPCKVTPQATNGPRKQRSGMTRLANRRKNLKWVCLNDNPWGEGEHSTGDVILYGPEKSVHFEATIPLRRYKVNPFSPGSSYRVTHIIPEQGLSLISLKRDSLGRVPWGFDVTRDEFGHGCLVRAVEPNSPASSAVWIGSHSDNPSCRCGLNINDMLIMINGKQVGGMTEEGLELELEMSAPNLYLAVSRYKYTNEVARKYAEIERRMLHSLDSTAQDERLIGWHEMGNAAALTVRNRRIGSVDRERDAKITATPNHCNTEESSVRQKDTEKRLQSKFELDNNRRQVIDTSYTREAHFGAGDKTVRDDFAKNTICPASPATPQGGKKEDAVTHDSDSDSVNSELDDDPNPWLGCICGEIHTSQKRSGDKMFWIQCEACNSWYDVAEQCVGFTENAAKAINWTCEACISSDSEVEDKTPTNRDVVEVETFQQDKGDVIAHTTTPLCGLNEKGSDIKNSANTSSTSLRFEIETSILQAPSNEKTVGLTIHTPNRQNENVFFGQKLDKSSLLYEKQHKAERQTRCLEDGCLLPKTAPAQRDDGTFVKPVGAPPRKLDWDESQGLWAPKESGGIADRKAGHHNQIARVESGQYEEYPAKGFLPPEGRKKRNDDFTKKGGKDRLTKQSHHYTRQKRQVSITTSEKPAPTCFGRNCAFNIGDLVKVEAHSSPGVNNYGGVGHVTAVTINEDGDRRYDVKYPIARFQERGILEKFVSLHTFG